MSQLNLEPFKDKVLLSAAHMSGKEMQYITSAFESNWIAPLGPNVTQFEQAICDSLSEKGYYSVAMCSGTAAIHIALILAGVKAGDEVLCSSATFIASAYPIMYEKAIPVFVDSEESTWNICPKALEKALEEKKRQGRIPKALIAVDLFGMSAKYKEISELCEKYGVILIEDSAESMGSTYHGKSCGTFGQFGIFSFNGNKIITTSGGGALLTKSEADAQTALNLITQARDRAPYYLHSKVGFNYRLSNVSAGIGIGQMQVLLTRVQQRQNVYQRYEDKLNSNGLHFVPLPEGFTSNRWLSTALLDSKTNYSPDSFIKKLTEYNIEARHIWKPLHTQPLFKDNEFFSVSKKPIAETIFERGVCLPSCSYMTEDTQSKVIQIIQHILKS